MKSSALGGKKPALVKSIGLGEKTSNLVNFYKENLRFVKESCFTERKMLGSEELWGEKELFW